MIGMRTILEVATTAAHAGCSVSAARGDLGLRAGLGDIITRA